MDLIDLRARDTSMPCRCADRPKNAFSEAVSVMTPSVSNGLLERVMGFEPTAPCLGSKHSTAELHPPALKSS